MPDPVDQPGRILVGKSDRFEYLTLRLGNRHGLVAGATGTGKTVTLQRLAECFSEAGVPVFLADVKGDLAGIATPGGADPAFAARARALGLAFQPRSYPVVFWDVFGEQGSPIRATIAEMGPLLLARLLELNDTQAGVLNIAFRVADEQGLLLLDLKDLRAMLGFVADHAGELTTRYGNVAPATVGTIQRALLVLENQGAANFFGEPALEIDDFLALADDGRGTLNILAAERLMRSPRLYATFLLWLLSQLFERLPEVGDPPKPKLVFFFDEAHLLFDEAPKALLRAVEQVVRLIRSKGVGVYFVTQNPLDVPDTVLGQLGNRVQHALRAFTPRDARAVKAAADTFRQNPAFDAATAITQLGVGEALVSMLQPDGTPEIVARSLIAPPSSRVGPLTAAERRGVIETGPIYGKYDTPIDRESAFELLQRRVAGPSIAAPAAPPPRGGLLGSIGGTIEGWWNGGGSNRGRMTHGQLIVRSAVQSAARSIGTQVAREVIRGVLGGLRR